MDIKISSTFYLFVSFLMFDARVSGAKTPSLSEIKNLKNSELDEIFGSAENRTPPDPDVPFSASGSAPPPSASMGRYNRLPDNGPREVPIDHGHALAGPQTNPAMGTNSGFEQLAAEGASVFANGANAFYRGAQTVGQAFGIPAANYQVPLFNQAASLFG